MVSKGAEMSSKGQASEQQIRELAQAIANQAQAIADGKIPEGQQTYAQAALIHNNADRLLTWTTPPEPSDWRKKLIGA
jgi:hypothetical protein